MFDNALVAQSRITAKAIQIMKSISYIKGYVSSGEVTLPAGGSAMFPIYEEKAFIYGYSQTLSGGGASIDFYVGDFVDGSNFCFRDGANGSYSAERDEKVSVNKFATSIQTGLKNARTSSQTGYKSWITILYFNI